ncbi:MAG TPA: hypothetical protein VGB98_25730 [Pyrinomonadaceae bacterium]|jgi:hypothetical protein
MRIRNLRTTALAFILLLAAVSPLAGCRREQPSPAPEAAAGSCPKLEGAYFGSDKSSGTRGEAARISLKLPREYVNERLRVEQAGGGGTSNLPFDLGALQEAVTPPALQGAKFPVWIERGIADVRPEQTTKYVLKAEGPKGCQPLELPATVYIIEPDGDGRAEDTGDACPDARKVKFWVAPQAENKNLVRLMWDAPGALRVEVAGHGSEVTRGSMLVDLRWHTPAGVGKEGRPEYAFSFVARKGECRPVEVASKLFTQLIK